MKKLLMASVVLMMIGCNKEAEKPCWTCPDSGGVPVFNVCADSEQQAYEQARAAQIYGITNLTIEQFRARCPRTR